MNHRVESPSFRVDGIFSAGDFIIWICLIYPRPTLFLLRQLFVGHPIVGVGGMHKGAGVSPSTLVFLPLGAVELAGLLEVSFAMRATLQAHLLQKWIVTTMTADHRVWILLSCLLMDPFLRPRHCAGWRLLHVIYQIDYNGWRCGLPVVGVAVSEVLWPFP